MSNTKSLAPQSLIVVGLLGLLGLLAAPAGAGAAEPSPSIVYARFAIR